MTDYKEEYEGCNCGSGHEEDCNCGNGHEEGCDCHHDHDHEEYPTIQLSLEDGREVTAAVLELFEIGDKEYIALLPIEEERVLLYEFREDEEGIQLINIESDEEFDQAAQVFQQLMEAYEEEDEN